MSALRQYFDRSELSRLVLLDSTEVRQRRNAMFRDVVRSWRRCIFSENEMVFKNQKNPLLSNSLICQDCGTSG